MNPLDPAILALSVAVTSILFALAAWWTQAALRRIAGALLGSAPLSLLVMLYDKIAAQLGWWYYPSVGEGNAPLAWYIAAALFYGAALGLVGWRIIRRYGKPGLVAFLVSLAVLGVGRDLIYSVTTEMIRFGPGPIPLIADGFAYVSAAAVVQLLMYWIAGPPGSDRLVRSH